MSSKVDKFVKTYKSLTQIPALLGGFIESNGFISSIWSQRNLEKGKSTKFLKQIFTVDLKKSADSRPVDISNELLSRNSHSEKYKAVLRENDNKQFLEIWQDYNIIRTVDLNALDLHGSVYTDVEFSNLEWSPDEKKILYVAERKPNKSEPFYKRKSAKPNESGEETKDKEKEIQKGEEYLFVQDWGEQLVGKKFSVLAEYDVENDNIEILKGIPDNICVAQPKYSPDGSYIVGVSYKTEPRKYGLIYCSNRESTLFKLDFEGNYTELQLENQSVKSPIFTFDGKTILWMQRKAGGPHASCMALMKTEAPFTPKAVVSTVVDFVAIDKKINNNKTFYGLYNTGFSRRPWASENRLILSTIQKYVINSYIIDIATGEITELSCEDGSLIILDVYNDTMLAVQRNFLKPDKLVIGKLPAVGFENYITWNELISSTTVSGLENCMYKYLDLVPESDGLVPFNAVYIGPKSGDNKSVPLIIWPHGGPHSAFANYLFMEGAMFLSFGFAILLVNYRGSIGSGIKSVEFLPGKIGVADVADCIQATDAVIQMFPWIDSNSLVLVGGSHGGFLVTHLSGQYPDKFKAVIARNPVIDVASMSVISDIPDWCYVEAGSEYTQKGEIDNKILTAMRNASPIIYAHKVKAPTLLQIGSKDLRVPPHQGTEYYHRLKANGVKTKMNLYDDNHPLGTVPNELDNIINTLLWIEEHLESSS